MSAVTCRWVREQLAVQDSTRLLEDEREQIARHLEACERCRDFEAVAQKVTEAAAVVEPAPVAPLVERRLVLDAVEGRMPRPKRKLKTTPGLLLVGAATATAIVVLALSLGQGVDPEQGSSDLEVAAPTAPDRVRQPQAEAEEGDAICFADSGEPIELQPGTLIWGSPDVALSAERIGRSSARLVLARGKVAVDIEGDGARGGFVVVTPSGETAVRGTVFTVEVRPDRTELTRVIEGLVEVTELSSGRVHVLGAGEQVVIGDEAPMLASRQDLDADLEMMGLAREPKRDEAPEAASKVTPGAQEPAAPVTDAVSGDLAQRAREAIKDKRLAEAEQLIEQAKAASPGSGEVPDLLGRLARGYRRVKQFRMAAEKYRALIFEYPSSNAGKNALVALAQMELGALGEPASALDHFGLYLEMAPGGMLAQEARIGRVRALARLGRHQELIAAAGQNLVAGQGGVTAAELHRRRGDARAATGDCQGAVKDYRTVIDKWPTSAEARRAEQGLEKCGEEKQP